MTFVCCSDGTLKFRCSQKRRNEVNIRSTNEFLKAHQQIPIWTLLKVIYQFSGQTLQKSIAANCELSLPTVSKIVTRIRSAIRIYQSHYYVKVGDGGLVSHTDHMYVGGKRKYNKGTATGKAQALQIGVDTAGVRAVDCVPSLEKFVVGQTLLKQHSQDSSTIITDEHGSFKQVSELFPKTSHLTVKHSGSITTKEETWIAANPEKNPYSCRYFTDANDPSLNNNRSESANGDYARFLLSQGRSTAIRSSQLLAQHNAFYLLMRNMTNSEQSQLFVQLLFILQFVYRPGEPAIELFSFVVTHID